MISKKKNYDIEKPMSGHLLLKRLQQGVSVKFNFFQEKFI